MASLPFVIGAMGLAGFTLERTRGKSHARLIKLLALSGLLFGVLGYISFMFIRSNVPGSGYSM
jgi:membrane associated rhomboid family serine protease